MNPSLFTKEVSIYEGSKPPVATVGEDTFTKLESSNRKSLNVVSYLDQFLAASKKHLRAVQDTLFAVDEGKQLDFEDVCDLHQKGEEVLSFLDSAAMANQDLGLATCDRISQLVTTRRDMYLENFVDIPEEEKIRLRTLPINTPMLFPQAEIEVAKGKSRDQKEDDLRSNMMKRMSYSGNYNRDKAS